MRLLDRTIERLLLGWQQVKVALSRGRQRFQQYFERIPIDPIPQVEQQDADFGIGEEQRRNVALAQVLGDAMIIRKVAIVHQRLVHADKGMRAARMPDAPLGGIPLMRNPNVSRQVLQAIKGSSLLGITHDFEHQEITPVTQHKRALVAQAGIVAQVEPEGVLVNVFVFHLARGQVTQAILFGKMRQHFRLDPAKVTHHVRRAHVETAHRAIVVQCFDGICLRDVETLRQTFTFHLSARARIEIRNLDEILRSQHVGRDAHLNRVESSRSNAAALAVASVVHLLARSDNVPAGNRNIRGKAQHTAAALRRLRRVWQNCCFRNQLGSRVQQ